MKLTLQRKSLFALRRSGRRICTGKSLCLIFLCAFSSVGAASVRAQNLASISTNPVHVAGGQSCVGTVTLDAPAAAYRPAYSTGGNSDPGMLGGWGSPIVVHPAIGSPTDVSLTSSNSAVAGAPASVSFNLPRFPPTAYVSLSAVSFTVKTAPVAVDTPVVLTASRNGVSISMTLLVHPPAPLTLAVNPTNVFGASSSMGIVTLDGPAPVGGTVVTLTSPDPAQASVPATVTVPAGATTATFPIITGKVTSTTSLILTATSDAIARTANLVIVPNLPFDFDGDGYNDLVFQNSRTGQLVTWSMNGANVVGGRCWRSSPEAAPRTSRLGS